MTSILFVIFEICRNYIKCYSVKNQNHVVNFSVHFLNLHQIFYILRKNMTFIAYIFSELQTERHCQANVQIAPFQSTLRQTTCQSVLNLNHSNFMISFEPFWHKRPGKSLCQRYFKPEDSLSKPLLLVTSILFLIARICWNQFKCSYLEM